MEIKINFIVFNQFNRRVGKDNPTGDGFESYVESFTDPKTGEIKDHVKKVNVYKMIQLARDTTDMKYIMSRIKAGDMSVLEKTKGVYLDSSDMPKDLTEAMAFDEKVEQVYKDNKLLHSVYKTMEEYKKDLFGGVDIIKKVNDYTTAEIEKFKKAGMKSPDKVKEDIKTTGVNEMKNVVTSEVKVNE